MNITVENPNKSNFSSLQEAALQQVEFKVEEQGIILYDVRGVVLIGASDFREITPDPSIAPGIYLNQEAGLSGVFLTPSPDGVVYQDLETAENEMKALYLSMLFPETVIN